MESKVEALLATIDEDPPVTFRLCDILKEIQFLKLGMAYAFDASDIFQEDLLYI
jgi:hypothetical protein